MQSLTIAKNRGCLLFCGLHGGFVLIHFIMLSERFCLAFLEFMSNRRTAWPGCEHPFPAVRGCFLLSQTPRKISPLNIQSIVVLVCCDV